MSKVQEQTKIKELLNEIIEIIEKTENEKEAKVKAIVKVFEVISELVKNTRNINIRIDTNWRQDFIGQIEYYYVFECSNGKCEAKIKQGDYEFAESEEVVAREILRDHDWDILKVLKHIKDSIY